MCHYWYYFNSCKALLSTAGNGKIERSFRTIKDNFLNCTDWTNFSSLDDLNEKYYQYINSQYNNHYHTSIEDTPRNRFMKDYSLLKFIPNEETLNEYFLYSYDRKVSTDSCIQLFNQNYEVPSKYMKQKITIKIDIENIETAYIYENGVKIETIHQVKKTDNSKIKRKTLSYSNQQNN